MIPRFSVLTRLLLFVALVFGVFPAKRKWLDVAMRGVDGTVVYLVDHVIELVAILIFGWVAAAVEDRSLASFGLPWRRALRLEFWQGALAALVSLGVLMLALHGTGAIRVALPSTTTIAAAGFGIAYAAIFVLLSLREEFLYRGYGLITLGEAIGFWGAAVASTAWFTWSHTGNANESPLGLFNIAFYGLIACFTLRRTGALWMAIGFHAAWNWGQTYLFGVADSGHAPAPGHLLTSTVSRTAPTWLSGGRVGPEGSAACAVVLALIGIVAAGLLPRGRYPDALTDPTPSE